jgi:hypothetical protein
MHLLVADLQVKAIKFTLRYTYTNKALHQLRQKHIAISAIMNIFVSSRLTQQRHAT